MRYVPRSSVEATEQTTGKDAHGGAHHRLAALVEDAAADRAGPRHPDMDVAQPFTAGEHDPAVLVQPDGTAALPGLRIREGPHDVARTCREEVVSRG
jgi:hypothetical protein